MLQSGHGHESHPQPVHACQTMSQSYRPPQERRSRHGASAGDDLYRRVTVAEFPGFEASHNDGTIVTVADAVEQVYVNLVRAVFDAQARGGSKELEQVVSQFDRINSDAHSRGDFSIGSWRLRANRVCEGMSIRGLVGALAEAKITTTARE